MAGNGGFKVIVNGEEFVSPRAQISVLQLRVLAGISPDFAFILEGHGPKPDQALSDTDIIDLTGGGVNVYAKPPTAFGIPRHVDDA